MTTKLLDNSVSVSSSTEISDEQVPAVSDTARNFDFHAEHNGEACIESLKPEDKGTERQCRFTRALLCTLLGVKSEDTITSHVDKLLKRGVVTETRNLVSVMLPDSLGRECIKTTLYDLTVFNYLVMRLDTDRAWAMKEKFNDVLVKHETGITQPELSDAEIMSRALEIAHRTLALREERIKALQAERDEAIRTKTQYQSNLAAQMSGRVGGLTTALNRVKLENDRLKGDRLTKDDVYIIMQTQGVSFTLKTVKDVIRDALNTISEYLDEPFPKIKTGEHTDGNGKVFDVQSYVYTRKTVKAFFEYVENNPLGWQARNRKFILGEWLHHGMTIPA